MQTLLELSQRLTSGAITARALVDEALDRAMDPQGEGRRVFITIADVAARARADEIDRARAASRPLPPHAGIPITIKDLFDVAGEITRAGSIVLADRPPARIDAPAVARLRSAGFIFIGRANMTEFAYSGLGINPHYGTPLNVFERNVGRIPGGSTSGGAVAVADGMAAANLGTDTGGSCRIPAAFNGIVGFKPTAHRVPREGAIPLSKTLDSIGPLAHSVQCCATLDAILRNAEPRTLTERAPHSIRLLLPMTLVLDGMEEIVARAFERAVDSLSRSGVTIERHELPVLAQIPAINSGGGYSAAEAYAWHRELLTKHPDQYDPRVASRIIKGRDATEATLRELDRARASVIDAVNTAMGGFDALILPSVPIVAPPLAAFTDDSEYARLNMLALRNPSLANFIDGCSITLPIQQAGEPPVGLMLIARRDDDERLFELAHTIERALRSTPS